MLIIYRQMHIKPLDATTCFALALSKLITRLLLEQQYLQGLLMVADNLTLA